MGKTSIEWTDHSWPIVNGCRRISPGCGRKAGQGGCYAERLISTRLSKTPKYQGLAVFTENGPRWTGESRLWTPHLDMPLRLKKPSKIFVADMGDLFFEKVTNEEIAAVFGVMAAAPRHTFQVLTKRPERMLEWFEWIAKEARELAGIVGATPPATTSVEGSACLMLASHYLHDGFTVHAYNNAPWPLPNVWLGVSVENQKYADERIPLLLKTPAATRFISAEPLLGPVNFASKWLVGDVDVTPISQHPTPCLDWVIVGSESGPWAQVMDVAWARSIVDQCKTSGTCVFVKQIATDAGRAAGDRKGGNTKHWPAGDWPRQFPLVTQ